jgi:hypothetical protein
MGVALGLIAIALAGAAGEPRDGGDKGQIRYTVRFIETEGMCWREAVFTRLTPVTRQGGATVWTAPGNVKQRLLQQALQDRDSRPIQTPEIHAWSGSPVHFSIHNSRSLVTQVAWDGDDRPEPGKRETVRTGPVGTMTGRKIDQGILVQLVLQDTEVRAVHHANINGPGEHPSQAATTITPAQPQVFVGQGNAAGLYAYTYQLDVALPGTGGLSPIKALAMAGPPSFECGTPLLNKVSSTKSDDARTVSIEVPEIASQEIAGEWLIPKDGILLVSFGPHTIAGKDGKAVIRERLAILEAAALDNGTVRRTAAASGFITSQTHMTPFVPATPRSLPAPVVAGKPPASFPALPSRSIPQGIHADGTPAELPPLPADDTDDSPSSESDEPRPSPQIKKPLPSPSSPVPDSQMKRTGYNTTSLLPSMPTVFLAANPTVGLQFLMPIKAVSLRLPFNRKLEIEIFGRIIRNPEPAEAPATLVVKPKGSESR